MSGSGCDVDDCDRVKRRNSLVFICVSPQSLCPNSSSPVMHRQNPLPWGLLVLFWKAKRGLFEDSSLPRLDLLGATTTIPLTFESFTQQVIEFDTRRSYPTLSEDVRYSIDIMSWYIELTLSITKRRDFLDGDFRINERREQMYEITHMISLACWIQWLYRYSVMIPPPDVHEGTWMLFYVWERRDWHR
jgi:hypothetical protein